MRRRLLASTFAIALACVVILGVPLALVARHQVWTSAHDRLRAEAASVGTTLEDRLDAGRPLELERYLSELPGRRIVVRAPGQPTVSAGRPFTHPLAETVVVADASVTVEAGRAATAHRATEVTLLVLGLGVLAVAAAVALALWQARRLAQPLAQLARRADALGRGQFSGSTLNSGVPEIDQVSAELERSARQLGSFVDLQQQFAADAAHQLRSPLTSIGLHLDEVVRVADPQVRQEAEEALEQVERLNRVITALLARARGDSAEPELLDLSALLQETTVPWRRLLAQAGRELAVAAPQPVWVRARREHVTGVLTSLLDNALAHGHGSVQASAARAGGQAVVRVRDEGAGVAPALREAVFDRRFSGRRAGTGIGLALARSLAESEGGRLELADGDAAAFLLVLPRAQGSP